METKEESENKMNPKTNGGIQCNVAEGPCACGAWHKELSDLNPQVEPKCASCGVPWTAHLGMYGTCAKLQTAIKALKQIDSIVSKDRNEFNYWPIEKILLDTFKELLK